MTRHPDFHFSHRFHVRIADADALEMVFDHYYLIYFDSALTEYFRSLPYDLVRTKRGTAVFRTAVAQLHIDRPLRASQMAEAYVRATGVAGSRLTFDMLLRDELAEAVAVRARLVWRYATPDGKAASIPADLLHLLRQREGTDFTMTNMTSATGLEESSDAI